MQVVNYVVNHNYMRNYHAIFASCHAYAKIVLKTITLSFPLFIVMARLPRSPDDAKNADGYAN